MREEKVTFSSLGSTGTGRAPCSILIWSRSAWRRAISSCCLSDCCDACRAASCAERSSCRPCANEHKSRNWHLPVCMKSRHSLVLCNNMCRGMATALPVTAGRHTRLRSMELLFCVSLPSRPSSCISSLRISSEFRVSSRALRESSRLCDSRTAPPSSRSFSSRRPESLASRPSRSPAGGIHPSLPRSRSSRLGSPRSLPRWDSYKPRTPPSARP